MQELGDNTIQRVDWPNVCPVVLIPRAYKFALGFRVIALAFLGLALTSLFAYLFVPNPAPPAVPQEAASVPLDNEHFANEEDSSLNVGAPDTPLGFVSGTTDRVFPSYSEIITTGSPANWYANVITFSKRESVPATNMLVPQDIAHPWAQLTATGREVFSQSHQSLFKNILWFAVVLVIWSWIGGTITRVVALRFSQDRRESLSQLADFMRKKWLSYIGAMILPLIGVCLVLIPVWLLGWLWQAVDGSLTVTTTFGYAAHTVGGFIHLILTLPFALAAVLVMIGFIFGWPLMFAAVSAEGSDAFDAVSRGFSYVYQRPVQFVFYQLCNLVFYTAGIIVAYFVFHEAVKLVGYDPTGLMILFNSFAFAYFWSSSTVIYFLLRRSCDATPYDQVYLGEIKKRTLPPFGFGKSGEPELKTRNEETPAQPA